MRPLLLAPLALGAGLLAGPACRSAYYATMETFGVHKREILVDRVEKGRSEQAAAQEQFKTTLQAFQELTGFEGGDLEATYSKLNRAYERSVDRADAVRERIGSIRDVAADLFEEWRDEIDEIENPDLRSKSRDLLDETRTRYDQLIAKMAAAEATMPPVLAAFKDHVLFLKHNLNAQAIASLRDTVVEIEDDVERLLGEMQASIDEADAFIAAMST